MTVVTSVAYSADHMALVSCHPAVDYTFVRRMVLEHT